MAGSSNFLPQAVFQFFNNGGNQAYICRVVGTGNATAAKTLQDRAGTPLNTLQINAANPGAWGNTLYVTITDSAPDRFNILVYLGGTADANVVERWIDLSMVPTDARYAPGIINSAAPAGVLVAGNGSAYISVVDQFSTTAAPSNRPALQTATVLAGGSDGVAVTPANIQAAVSNYDQVQDIAMILNLPGTTDTPTLTTAINYAANRQDMFVVCEPPAGTSVATASTTFATGLPVSSYGATYFPWVFFTDPSSAVPGATVKLPPGGAIVGQYCRTDTMRGPWKTPAGVATRLPGAVGIETLLLPADLDTLNLVNVNAIRQISGTGIVLMGGRTLQTDASTRYISIRRTLIYIRTQVLAETRWAVFEPNDASLWRQLSLIISSLLSNIWHQGGLRGDSADQAFYVKCDSDINNPTTIAAGTVNIEIGVAAQYPAEFIVMTIGLRDNSATATVTAA